MKRQMNGLARPMWQSVWLTVDGPDPDEHLVVGGHRTLHLLEPEDVGRPVPVVHDRSHAVRTIFPRACPSPR